MPNIYLRVPTYVAQFYRAIDPNKRLAENQPYAFCPFQHEYILMRNQLTLIPETEQTCSWCYSQRAFNNILRGIPPTGGKAVVQRDQQQWITTKELCAIIGEKSVAKMEAYDYLAIELPPDVMLGDEVRKTNGSYSLKQRDAIHLQEMLRDEFVHTFLDWLIQDRRYCNRLGLRREIGTTIERFFERYYIFIGTNKRERESMYRMGRRWIEKARVLPNDRIDFGEDMTFVTEREQQEADDFDFVGEINTELKKANKCKSTCERKLNNAEKPSFACP
jgi:hypothetical protein